MVRFLFASCPLASLQRAQPTWADKPGCGERPVGATSQSPQPPLHLKLRSLDLFPPARNRSQRVQECSNIASATHDIHIQQVLNLLWLSWQWQSIYYITLLWLWLWSSSMIHSPNRLSTIFKISTIHCCCGTLYHRKTPNNHTEIKETGKEKNSVSEATHTKKKGLPDFVLPRSCCVLQHVCTSLEKHLITVFWGVKCKEEGAKQCYKCWYFQFCQTCTHDIS